MPVPTNRAPGDFVESEDINNIAALANQLESDLENKASNDDLVAGLNSKANVVHYQSASTINTGTLNSNVLPGATTSSKGAIELSTSLEAAAGTATNLAVTPNTLRYAGDQRWIQRRGWNAFTPNWNPTPTTWGNSTRQGYYLTVDGQLCHFVMRFVIGSTFSAGSGYISIPLPVPAKSGIEFVIPAHLVSTSIAGGNGESIGNGKVETDGGSIKRLYFRENSSSVNSLITMAHNSGWSTNDRLIISGSYYME